MPVRVLIVDDQEPFRMAARMVVDATDGFDVVGEAETGEDSVTMAADADFSRYACAPAWNADRTAYGSSDEASTTSRFHPNERSSVTRSRPLPSGRPRSLTTTSGASRSASESACARVSACETR